MKLYFVSDRKLGKGGTDIYSSVFTSEDEVTIPENMETINTIGNEYSPYYNARRNVLYFSSDGYSGFGGLDIFKYFFAPKDSIHILNLGASVNTSYDDLSFSIDSAARNGYLASNRPGSRYIDETLKACCFDLYKSKFNTCYYRFGSVYF
ncbi:MAG: PD40 domain-containing protein [Saprospiraceae bacterium]|nr:PD40 domain-containing protein [Saprospiraceae bacterium]